ncbi:MAG: hypothetical protein VB099_19885 [Candidatus Limiplasma sp.]|nr:hypothetical protein [Candidatus Limiplasma sp.]
MEQERGTIHPKKKIIFLGALAAVFLLMAIDIMSDGEILPGLISLAIVAVLCIAAYKIHKKSASAAVSATMEQADAAAAPESGPAEPPGGGREAV